MKNTIAVVLLLFHVTIAGAGDRSGPIAVEGLEGVWKICYEPGLPEVYEIDEGFLILMPDGRYYEVSESCCYDGEGPPPPYWEMGSFTVTDDLVVFEHKRFDGTSYQTRLRHVRDVRAVFFDGPGLEPSKVDALMSGDNLNYSWCREYPYRENVNSLP